MPPMLYLRLLGQFEARLDERPLPGFESPRLQSLLARLILHAGVPQSRQQLAYLYWPDSPEQQARTNLRRLVYDLRLALPDADRYLDLAGPALQWRADARYTLDVAQFRDAVERADTPEAIAGAVALYRGDLLPHLYDEWLLPERARLRETFTQLLERAIAATEQVGDLDASLGYVRRLVEHDPLHEPAYRHLMRLAALRGDRTGVAQAYRACVATLERELGAEPSEETRQLYEQLRAGPSPPAPVPVPAA